MKEIEWINGKNQIADELTKEQNNNNGINDYLNDVKRNWGDQKRERREV